MYPCSQIFFAVFYMQSLINPWNVSVSSYLNQSIDLHSKSIDWFLCEGNAGISWVNEWLHVKHSKENLSYKFVS